MPRVLSIVLATAVSWQNSLSKYLFQLVYFSEEFDLALQTIVVHILFRCTSKKQAPLWFQTPVRTL